MWLGAACAGRAPEGGRLAPAAPAADASEVAPGDTLPPGTYEPFEPAGTTAPDTLRAPGPREAPSGGAAPSVTPVAPGSEPAYVIQVAAFGEREPADDVAYLLRRRYPDYVTRVVERAGLFRVWLGGWPTREQAAPVLLIVRQRHADAWIVAP